MFSFNHTINTAMAKGMFNAPVAAAACGKNYAAECFFAGSYKAEEIKII